MFLLNGALAQLARVLDWQSRGHGFDSRRLHLCFDFILISEGFSIVFSEREGHEEIQLRKQQEISQTELAKQRGIHKNEMGQYERN